MSKLKVFFLYYAPVLFIAGLIFYSSSQPYGKQDIRPELSHLSFLAGIVKHFDFIHFTYAKEVVSIDALGVPGFTEFFIRKLSHFTIYLLLCFFTTRLINFYKPSIKYLGFVFSVVYASSDEFHQMFTADRSPLVQDVILDSIGALIGFLLFNMLWKKVKKQKKSVNK
jgi:VanZ family protein